MRTFTALAILLFLPPAALAGPATAPADEVGTLIHDLSSDSYQTREDATQKLVRLGESALPRLQKLLPLTTDGETRNRIQSAVDQITEASVAGETLLTLDVKDADPKSVFDELSRQAHADVRVPADVLASLPKVTFRCDQEPFWPALKKLCAPLGLAPESVNMMGMGMFGRRTTTQQQGADHVLNLVRAGDAWERTPTAYSGPFMICVQRVTRTGMVVPATGQRVHNVMMECLVQAEPKLTVVGRNPTARVTLPDPVNAAPPAGVMVGGFRPPFASRAYYNASPASVWPLVVPLTIPNDAADKLPELKAVSSAKVQVRAETWELPDIAHAAPRSWNAGGRTFAVTSVKRQGDAVEVLATATATQRPSRGMDPEDMAAFNTLELLDPQGRPLIARVRSPRPSEDPTKLAFTIVFQATPEGAPILPASTPLRLRWRLPLETKDVEIAIDLADVPLP